MRGGILHTIRGMDRAHDEGEWTVHTHNEGAAYCTRSLRRELGKISPPAARGAAPHRASRGTAKEPFRI